MTLEDVKAMRQETITPDVAAKILGCDPQYIRVAARSRPDLLGFPVSVVGNRTKIPRRGFINFMEGGRSA